MINFFKDKFALSTQGAIDLKRGIFASIALNLSYMLPLSLAIIFIDDLLNKGALKSLWFYAGFGLNAFIFMYFLAYFQYKKVYVQIYQETQNTRINLAQVLQKLPMSFFGQKDISDLSSAIMEDVNQIETLFSHSVPQIFASIVSIFVVSLLVFFYQPLMSLAIFLVLPLGFLVYFLMTKKLELAMKNIYKTKRHVAKTVQEGLELAQEIKSYGYEDAYLQDLHSSLSLYEKKLLDVELFASSFLNLSVFALKLGFPSVILIGAFLLYNGDISVFVYLVFLIIVSRIYDPFIEAMNNFALLLVLKPRIKRIKQMQTMPKQEGRADFTPKNFDIEFKNVNFSYDRSETIKDVSFVAKQGEITALIGVSGGGKSTVAKLALRFWDINSGTITLGGIDISTILPESLMRYFSIVFQDVVLFDLSVLENIRLGKKDATNEQVRQAASLAMCDDFVQNLPNGYDTQIGENGEKLSGGERQRISIARALLKNAPIVILDEATASLDAQNETQIQAAISSLIKDKTVIIIAHRMRTIVNAHKIIAIDKTIKETGTPKELLEKNSIFKAMLEKQMAT